MANPEHVAIIKQGVAIWNQWRENNPKVKPDFTGTDLSNMDLMGANLNGSDLRSADLIEANLTTANFNDADLTHADLNMANLINSNLIRANLRSIILRGADLRNANLSYAYLGDADLSHAHLGNTNLSYTDTKRANLSEAIFTGTILEHGDISGCRIYGISAWNLKTENLTQSNLIITKWDEPEITIDNLEIAQFVYLLLNNSKLRGVIDTLTTKSVLILGRFTDERKAVLDAIREELRKHDYVPILFDFDKPANRDLTETVMTLASLARFVIADLSDPNSIPHELMSFADKLFSVPVQGIFCPTTAHPTPYPMYEHLRRLPHVLPIYRYDTPDHLITTLAANVIRPAEEMVKTIRPNAGLTL